jgi:hypothetical protein
MQHVCAMGPLGEETEAVISASPTRKHPHTYDCDPVANQLERMFCRFKGFRRMAIR